MNGATKRTIALGAIVATAVGGGAAWAATSSTQDLRTEYLNDVAKRLDVSSEKLTSALKGAYLEQLDDAVKAGRLTQEQADALKKRVEQAGVPLALGGPRFGPGGKGFGHRFGHGALRHGTWISAAASFLGVSRSELREQLRSGKSLADVAKDKGKSKADLVSALVAAEKKKLDQAVEDKRITDAQRDAIGKDLPSRIEALVDGRPPAGGPPRGPWGEGDRGAHFPAVPAPSGSSTAA